MPPSAKLRKLGMSSSSYRQSITEQSKAFLKQHRDAELGRTYEGTKRKSGKTAVYLIACGGYVKIGFSKNPVARMIYMQVGNPIKLELICQFECPANFHAMIERDIHKTFEAWRVRGEWFELERSLAAHLVSRVIEQYTRVN